MRRRFGKAWRALNSRRHSGPSVTPSPDAPDATLLESLADSLEPALVIVDLGLHVLHWNTAMEQLTGVARAQAQGRSVRRLAPILDALALSQHLQRAWSGEARSTVETSAGVWMEARCVPLLADGGRVVGAAAYLTDISEHKRRGLFMHALGAIGRSLTTSLDLNETLDTIVGKALEVMSADSALVVSWDGSAAELRVMRAAGRLSDEYASSGAIPVSGGPISRAVLESRPFTTANVLTDDRVWLGEPRRRQIEREGFKAVGAAPLVSKGRVHGALVVHYWTERTFTDEQTMALGLLAEQAAIAIDNAVLYANAQESLARLRETQAQLIQAGKMSALGQLVSGVAHELNNPLSVIIGYGQLLLNRGIPDSHRRPVELMVQQGDRMAKIVKNLLYFARQRPPERTAVDLHQVIEQTLALRLNQLGLSGISVDKDFAPSLPRVSGDAQQLQQVFLNLILNAEQAITGEGRTSGQIVFRTRVTRGGRWVHADVIDDGPGIAPEYQARVFEPFFTTKEVGAGTGLGLSVSYGIVEQHGGRLGVESRPGRTVFTLELPVGAPVAPPGPGSPVSAFDARGKLALVVEDEAGVVELIVTLLRDTGWRVDVADGGRRALECVRTTRYDLVISDMRMPDGDGEAFYRMAVTENPSLGGRFLFITGDTANVAGWDFFKEAKVPVLEKPFRPDAFIDLVRRVATSLTSSGSRA